MTPEPSLGVRSVDGGRATLLEVRAQPGARRVGPAGLWNGRLKLAVAAPPEKGRANTEVIARVARLFGLRPSSVTLVRGHSSRLKTVRLELPPEDVRRRLSELLD